MACVELPKDATGLEIPLDTKLLYDKEGNPKEVSIFTYAPRSYSSGWNVVLAGGFERFASAMFLNPPEPPDSWEKLEDDLQRITAGPTEWFCMYAGRDKRDTGCHSNCKFFKDNMSCEKQAVLDIVFRIRKLRGEG